MNTQFIEYRVNFIRGRSQNVLDTMLPAFANSVADVCPTSESSLTSSIASHLARYFPNSETKTLNNYATEIVGQLFGMVVHHEDGTCDVSDLTSKLLLDSDQPAFFKVLISRIQFPNPMNRNRLDYEQAALDGCHVRPLVLVLEVLRDISGPVTYLELRTFVLANLLALNGKNDSKMIAQQILSARAQNMTLPNPHIPNKPFHHQHIKELLGFLVLANLIRESSSGLYELNRLEAPTLDWIFKTASNQGLFRGLGPDEDYKTFQRAWTQWYGSLPSDTLLGELDTPIEALEIDLSKSALLSDTKSPGKLNTQEVGRIGEEIVLNWQLQEVTAKRPQDIKHVKDRSMERGIGFDVQSVWCDSAKAGEFKYLEVKTTKRATRPDRNSSQLDLVNLTSNEYRAAKSHAGNFSVCRVYLFAGGFEVFIITDPVAKGLSGEVILEPADWSMYITDKALGEPDFWG